MTKYIICHASLMFRLASLLPHLVSSVSFKFLLLYTAIYLNIYPKNPPAVYIFMLCYVL